MYRDDKMKIRYGTNGNIEAVSINSFPLGGSPVVTVTDSSDLLANPNKYIYTSSTNTLSLNKYLKLTANATSAPADGMSTIIVTVTAYTPSGSVDTSASYSGTIHKGLTSTAFTLASGVATASFTSSTPVTMNLVGNSSGIFGGNVVIQFT